LNEAMFEAQRMAAQPVDLPSYVVVPFKDKHELTQQLVDALDGYAKLLLFDNGSEVPPPASWGAIPAANLNIHEMWNQGVEMALSESGGACNIAILNNDIKVGPRFLDELALALRSDPRLVVVSPNYDNREFDADIQPVRGICAGRYDGTGGMAGFAFMVKGEWFAQGWRFPEEYDFFFGDTEFAVCVEQAGGLIGIVKRVPCEHIGGGGQTPRPEPESVLMHRDGDKFKAKWNASSK
jgi:GT2 family glycosyltransferase